jgi:hypothetical protein
MGLEPTGLFDTHPSNGDRIRRARQANEPGIFHLDTPASALFTNFDVVAKQVTLLHYSDDLGLPLEMAKLTPVATASANVEEPEPASEPARSSEAAPRLKFKPRA